MPTPACQVSERSQDGRLCAASSHEAVLQGPESPCPVPGPQPHSSEVTTVLPASILTRCILDDACYVFSKASRFVSSISVGELWPCCVEQWLAPVSVGKTDALTLTGGLRWGWDEVGH